MTRERNPSKAATSTAWVFLLPSAGAWCFVPGLSPFLTMCVIAITLFVTIKLHVLVVYVSQNGRPSWSDMLAWFIGWPGLSAGRFFRKQNVTKPSLEEWCWAIGKTAFGMVVLLLVAPRLRGIGDLVSGWTALLGVVFFLHFGVFHLAALFWRHQGRDIRPIMNCPICATSVNEFWSRRWNLAFRDYASPFVFLPLARRTSPLVAVVAGYSFSGIIHEIAISAPAGAGFGLPTLYFMLQGTGIILERAAVKSGFALTSGVRGWVWTAAITAPGALLLFHPPFIRTVVLPLVDFIASIR
ncbi:MAG: MBOAT family protein [Fuerstiella sp.]